MEYRIIGWTAASREDFPELSQEKRRALRHLIIKEIIQKGYVFSGDYHEWGDSGSPVFNSGEKYVVSTRAWAHLMAEAYEAEGTKAYARWMFDEWVENTEVGACGIRYPNDEVDYSLIVDPKSLTLPKEIPQENNTFSIEEYVKMLQDQKKDIEELGIRTMPSCDTDSHPLTVNMYLDDEPFYLIAQKKKTVELRLFDEKRARLAVGDKLQLELRSDCTKYIIAYVKNLYLANSFEELLTPELLPLCGLGAKSAKEGAKIMRRYYSESEEKEHGVIGIELDVRHIIL